MLAAVAPLADSGPGGRSTFASGAGAAIPASTTKLVTSTAALLALGPDHVFTTSVGRHGQRSVDAGWCWSVGATRSWNAARRTPRRPTARYAVALPAPRRPDHPGQGDSREPRRAGGCDGSASATTTSLFTGPADNPTWEADYVPGGEVAPTTALWVDEGRPLSRFGRVADPAAEAGAVFVSALREAGVKVTESPVAAPAPAGAETVASVDSAPLAEIVQRILDVSDNEGAEVLLRHVGLATADTGLDRGRHQRRTPPPG